MVRLAKRGIFGRGGAGVLLLAFVLSSTAGSWAATPEEKAAAEAQFDEGLKLLKAGNYEAATKKFESSQRVDPGIGTLLYLGECYEKTGKTASAWATFREAASMAQAAGQPDRARIGTQRADKLVDKLSKLTVEVPESDAAIEGLEIRNDKQVLSKSLWGTPVPVDPGQHSLTISAPGYKTAEVPVTVAAGGQAQTVTMPALEKLPASEQPVPVAAPVQTATPEDSGTSDGSGQRTAGLITMGAGVVGLGVGTVFGIFAISANSTAKSEGCTPASCPAGNPGIDDANSARDHATISTIGFIAGGVLAAAGAVIYFTAPSAAQTAKLEVTPSFAGATLSLGGTF